MLKRTFDYYAIYTSDSETRSSDKAFFDTIEEAFNERMNYANWWEPEGNVYIRHYRLHDNKNEIIDEFKFFGDTYGAQYRMVNILAGRLKIFLSESFLEER